ncbi:hypothetical protein B0H10DRAFT_544144 [Mycena sp. CBHHK59/15]|nr:hypothetical protein B0H10DRAFT_544144 [Mycena sp. CBHHK59/15]
MLPHCTLALALPSPPLPPHATAAAVSRDRLRAWQDPSAKPYRRRGSKTSPCPSPSLSRSHRPPPYLASPTPSRCAFPRQFCRAAYAAPSSRRISIHLRENGRPVRRSHQFRLSQRQRLARVVGLVCLSRIFTAGDCGSRVPPHPISHLLCAQSRWAACAVNPAARGDPAGSQYRLSRSEARARRRPALARLARLGEVCARLFVMLGVFEQRANVRASPRRAAFACPRRE